MRDEFLLYISAASDLDALRDQLARAVTEIPVTLNWRIVQSPLTDQPLDFGAIRSADLHILILGGDIRAPIGLEWLVARQVGKTPQLFLQEDAHRTQAAGDFVRHVELQARWQAFVSPSEVRRHMLRSISERLLHRSNRYRLHSAEIEALTTWLPTLDEQTTESASSNPIANTNSIILSVERFTPSGGVLLKEPTK